MHGGARQRKFPAWTGPTIGALAGAFLGAKALAREGPLVWEHVVWAAAIGAAGGSLFVLQDLTCRHRIPAEQLPAPRLAKFMSVAQLFVCFIPFVGWMVSIFALILNWRAQGGQNAACWIGFLVGAFITIGLVVLLLDSTI